MKNIFVDTDIIIDYTRGHNQILKTLLEKQRGFESELFINPIVTAEFFTDKNLKNKEKLEEAKKFFQFFTVVTLDQNIGFTAAKLLRDDRVAFLGDALIAATCLKEKLLLATRNRKHYQKVLGLDFLELKE